MAKAKVTRRLPGNASLRRRVEEQELRLRLDALDANRKALKQLATYRGAERGRMFRDWKSPVNASADYAILSDVNTLLARSRQLVRDSWIAKAAVRAVVRNTAGRGIEIQPATPDNAANKGIKAAFAAWGNDASRCDFEGKRTWWALQQFAVAEEFAAGECLIQLIRDPAGLRLKCLEPELLDTSLTANGSNEIRGGVEIDGNGRAVAYHVRTRHDIDYQAGRTYATLRIAAEDVIHFFRPERATQTRGVSHFAPVMADIYQLSRFDQAHEARKRIEACVGLVIKQTLSTPAGSLLGLGPLQAGQSATLSSGERAFEMSPGMIATLEPGEDASAFQPSSTATEYQTYFEAKLRGIGAALGLSFGALYRRSDGNYSSARQDMLEDERELRPGQDALIDQVVSRVYAEWFSIEAAGGRLPVSPTMFAGNEAVYLAHEAIPPVRPWIDPEKEANAYERLLALKLIAKEDITGAMGKQYESVVERIQANQTLEESLAGSTPEGTQLNGVQATAAQGVIMAASAGQLGEIAATELLVGIGIARPDAVRIAQEATAKAATQPTQPQEPAPNEGQGAAFASTFSDTRINLKQLFAPNYRAGQGDVTCGTCRWNELAACKAHGFTLDPMNVCDDHESRPKQTGAPRAEGDPPIDNVSARDTAN